MAPIVLADKAVLGTRIDHHLEGLVQILKFAEELVLWINSTLSSDIP